MKFIDGEDWSNWIKKLKWQLISFKFLSFSAVLTLLVLFWISLEEIFIKTVKIAKDLKTSGFISEKEVSEIITKSQSVLYDSAFSHIMIGAAAVLAAIIAIKGISYVVEGGKTKEIVKKLENGDLSNNLKRFLPKR